MTGSFRSAPAEGKVVMRRTIAAGEAILPGTRRAECHPVAGKKPLHLRCDSGFCLA